MPRSEQTLPGYELTEADMVKRALAMPLAEKVTAAIGLLQLWEPMALQLSDRGYWLAYSGGKDSDVILELAKMAGVRYRPVYNVTTIDPPELVRYIRREHHEVEFCRPKKSLLSMLAEDKSCGPPTRLARWCCQKYKEQGGNGTAKVIGVRCAESARRAKLWKSVMPNHNGGIIVCPIAYWSERDVWAFHRLRNLTHCELYDEGFKRLGCIGCPLAGPKNQARDFARWPLFERNWKRAVFAFWEKWHGVPTEKGKRRWFEDLGGPEQLWQWWLSGRGQGKRTECQGEFLYT